ncbi:MAG TPA: response regulator [Candidatus Limnocylindrales bacterium]|nr:response regulator [Candidatus Limnocylindrales bacterium]
MTDQKFITPKLNILIIDDDPNSWEILMACLEGPGYLIVEVDNPQDALMEASRRPFDLAFVDLRLGTKTGLDFIPRLLAGSPWIKIVVITAYASVDTAVKAMKRGAVDYLSKPFNPSQVSLMTKRLAEIRALEQKVAVLQEALGQASLETELISFNPTMQRGPVLARQIAQSHVTILIQGESGTDKGVPARAIHAWSPRATKSFSVVSSVSLSAEPLESSSLDR